MKCQSNLSIIAATFLVIAAAVSHAQVTQSGLRIGHTSTVNAIAISPDGKSFATCSADGAVIVWDLASGSLQRTLDGTTDADVDESAAEKEISFTSLAYSPNGLTLAAATGDQVMLFDPKTGRSLATLKDAQYPSIKSLEFSPDGRILAIASGKSFAEVDEDTLTLWDVTGKKKIRSLAGATAPIAFDLSGRSLATSGESHWVQVWNVASGKRLVALKTPKEFNRVKMFSFNKGGTIMAALTDVSESLGDYGVLFLNLASGKLAKTGASAKVQNIARFTADGINFIQDPSELEIVSPASGKRVAVIERFDFGGSSWSLSRNGSILASLPYGDKSVRLINLVSKKATEVKIGYTTNVISAAFTPDSRKLVAGYDDIRIIRWDVATGKIDKVVFPTADGKPDNTSFIGAPLVSGDSMRFLPSSGSYAVFDSTTGERTIGDDDWNKIDSHDLAPDGKHSITITKETVTIRNSLTGKLVNRFLLPVVNDDTSEIRVASSYDNKIIALATEKQVSFWDPATGNKIKELPADDEYSGETFGFSPDGQFFVFTGASHDNKINVIRYISQEEVLLLEDSFPYFAISPDSKTIASINSDKHLVLTSLIDSEAEPIISEKLIRIVDYVLSEGDFGLVYSPDSKNIAVYGPYGITIFDAQTAELKGRMK